MKTKKIYKRALQTVRPINVSGLPARMERALELPVGSLTGGARIELAGNRRAVVDSCHGIIEYCSDSIRLNTGSGILRFTGRNLSLCCLTQDSAVVEGCILSIEFLS